MKYFLSFIFSIFCSFIIWSLLVFGQSGNPSKMSQWVFDVYEKKIEISNKIKEKKIVIVAGSNAMFGINSQMLSNTFNKPVINFGVNAGIELPLTLHLAKKILNSNDTIIMPLEYSMYSYDGEMGIQMIDYLLSREKNFFFELTLKEKIYLLWKIDLKRVLNGYFNKSEHKIEVGLYGYNNIDQNGDQINTDLRNRLDVYYNGISIKPEEHAVKFKKDALSWDYLSDFANWCNERNIKIYFMPTTMMQHSQYFEKDKWYYQNINKILQNKGFNFIGNAFDYMYKKEYYFDTNYHLIDEARDFRTKQMIKDLKEVIN